MRNITTRHAGFTLVEAIFVTAIFSFITLAIYGTLSAARRSWLTGEALVRAQQEARLALAQMSKELRLSSPAHVSVAADRRSLTFDIPYDADGDGFLDTISGSTLLLFGADDAGDFDGDGVLWERDWEIRYAIENPDNLGQWQIVREVYVDAAQRTSQTVLVGQGSTNINPDVALTNFQTEAGGTGVPTEAVNISLTTVIDSVQGTTLSPPIEATLTTRVNFRN